MLGAVIANRSTVLLRRYIWLPLCVTAVVFCNEAAVAGGLAPPTGNLPVHTSDDATSIGHVAWEITETSSGEVLGKGSRDLLMSDVQVIADQGDDYLEQRIPLSAGFYLKLNSGRNEEPFSGFGLAAGKQYQVTFSWEWFTVESAGRAEKLQETGNLAFESEKMGNAYEITKTHFLSDISMRVLDYEKENADPRDPTWRVKILKGSEINWPTFAGGKVMAAKEAKAWHAAHPPAPGFWESLVDIAEENTTGTRAKGAGQ